jgi:hypothetical protein
VNSLLHVEIPYLTMRQNMSMQQDYSSTHTYFSIRMKEENWRPFIYQIIINRSIWLNITVVSVAVLLHIQEVSSSNLGLKAVIPVEDFYGFHILSPGMLEQYFKQVITTFFHIFSDSLFITLLIFQHPSIWVIKTFIQ